MLTPKQRSPGSCRSVLFSEYTKTLSRWQRFRSMSPDVSVRISATTYARRGRVGQEILQKHPSDGSSLIRSIPVELCRTCDRAGPINLGLPLSVFSRSFSCLLAYTWAGSKYIASTSSWQCVHIIAAFPFSFNMVTSTFLFSSVWPFSIQPWIISLPVYTIRVLYLARMPMKLFKPRKNAIFRLICMNAFLYSSEREHHFLLSSEMETTSHRFHHHALFSFAISRIHPPTAIPAESIDSHVFPIVPFVMSACRTSIIIVHGVSQRTLRRFNEGI